MNSETVSYNQEKVAPAKTFVNRDVSQTRVIAGVSVSDSPLITAVIEHAQQLSEPYLFNHAMRSWLFAETVRRVKGIACDREIVAIGTILHDIGLTAHVSGANRFSEQPRTHRVIEQIRFGESLRILNHGRDERTIGYGYACNQSSLRRVPIDKRLRWCNRLLFVADRFSIHPSSPLLTLFLP